MPEKESSPENKGKKLLKTAAKIGALLLGASVALHMVGS